MDRRRIATASIAAAVLLAPVACSAAQEGTAARDGAAAPQKQVGNKDARIDRLQDKISEIESKDAELDRRKANLEERSTKLDNRDQELSQQEKEDAKNSVPGDGVFLVGPDIEPGTYRTDGPVDAIGCYWARLSGTSGELGDVITNGTVTGPTTVTIAASDAAFETSDCQDWHLRDEATGGNEGSGGDEPAQVVRAFYDAINAGDYRAAWEMGGSPMFGEYEGFAAGYSSTVHDTLTITGVDGDTVYVDLVAEQADGSLEYYTGSYTVKDGVIVDDAMREVS